MGRRIVVHGESEATLVHKVTKEGDKLLQIMKNMNESYPLPARTLKKTLADGSKVIAITGFGNDIVHVYAPPVILEAKNLAWRILYKPTVSTSSYFVANKLTLEPETQRYKFKTPESYPVLPDEKCRLSYEGGVDTNSVSFGDLVAGDKVSAGAHGGYDPPRPMWSRIYWCKKTSRQSRSSTVKLSDLWSESYVSIYSNTWGAYKGSCTPWLDGDPESPPPALPTESDYGSWYPVGVRGGTDTTRSRYGGIDLTNPSQPRVYVRGYSWYKDATHHGFYIFKSESSTTYTVDTNHAENAGCPWRAGNTSTSSQSIATNFVQNGTSYELGNLTRSYAAGSYSYSGSMVYPHLTKTYKKEKLLTNGKPETMDVTLISYKLGSTITLYTAYPTMMQNQSGYMAFHSLANPTPAKIFSAINPVGVIYQDMYLEVRDPANDSPHNLIFVDPTQYLGDGRFVVGLVNELQE